MLKTCHVTVLIAGSFSMCYAMLSMTVDALALMALTRRSRELLIPWLAWYILDMGKSFPLLTAITYNQFHSMSISAIYVSVMVLVILFLQNYLILLVIFKIIWTLFVWVNVRDLHATGKIYGPSGHRLKRARKSDILY